MQRIDETDLPGLGVRRDLTLESGERIGVVARRDGEHDLVVYERTDPESCQAVIRLRPADVRALRELLKRSAREDD